ncbi:TolC family protein [Spirosoma spitsbergense]|uniref:TolC family protein n=1 Tax=Spirosoma spitsbergense TaxID=431554 RepID=UPI00036C21D8|nr:TolC family protein [Spirosoma spitsbergense]
MTNRLIQQLTLTAGWLLIGALSGVYGQAATPPGGTAMPLTLTQALDRVQQTYPSIKARQAQVSAALYGVKERQADYLPHTIFQSQALYGTSNQVQGTFFPNEGTAIPIVGAIKPAGNTPDMVWTSFATLLTDWAFFDFGKVRSTVQVARGEVATQKAALTNEIFQQQVRTADAYLLTLVTHELVQQQQANLTRVETFRQMTTARAQSGLRPGVDSSLAQAEVSRARLILTEAQQAEQTQKIRLGELTGLDPAAFSVSQTAFYETLPATVAEATYIDNNPVLQIGQAEILTTQDQAKAARLSWLPSFRLLGAAWARGSGLDNVKAADGNLIYHKGLWDGVKFRAYDVMVGPVLYWELSNYWRASNRAQQFRLLGQSRQFDLDEERLGLNRQRETANLDYAFALASVTNADQQIRAARGAYEQSLSRYNAGLTGALELSQAFAILNRAEIDKAVSTASVWQSLLKQAAATGELSAFTSKTTDR